MNQEKKEIRFELLQYHSQFNILEFYYEKDLGKSK